MGRVDIVNGEDTSEDGMTSRELKRAHFQVIRSAAEEQWRVVDSVKASLTDSKVFTKRKLMKGYKGADGKVLPRIATERVIPVLPNAVTGSGTSRCVCCVCCVCLPCCLALSCRVPVPRPHTRLVSCACLQVRLSVVQHTAIATRARFVSPVAVWSWYSWCYSRRSPSTSSWCR
jgi:hypothetical protein